MSGFAQRVRLARRKARMTQEQLGHAAGCSGMTISTYERGIVETPDSATLAAVAKVLGVEPAWLLFGTESDTIATDDEALRLVESVLQADHVDDDDATAIRAMPWKVMPRPDRDFVRDLVSRIRLQRQLARQH